MRVGPAIAVSTGRSSSWPTTSYAVKLGVSSVRTIRAVARASLVMSSSSPLTACARSSRSTASASGCSAEGYTGGPTDSSASVLTPEPERGVGARRREFGRRRSDHPTVPSSAFTSPDRTCASFRVVSRAHRSSSSPAAGSGRRCWWAVGSASGMSPVAAPATAATARAPRGTASEGTPASPSRFLSAASPATTSRAARSRASAGSSPVATSIGRKRRRNPTPLQPFIKSGSGRGSGRRPTDRRPIRRQSHRFEGPGRSGPQQRTSRTRTGQPTRLPRVTRGPSGRRPNGGRTAPTRRRRRAPGPGAGREAVTAAVERR